MQCCGARVMRGAVLPAACVTARVTPVTAPPKQPFLALVPHPVPVERLWSDVLDLRQYHALAQRRR